MAKLSNIVSILKYFWDRVNTLKADKATTLSGYGITDGVTSDTLDSYVKTSSIVDSVTSGNTNPVTSNAVSAALSNINPTGTVTSGETKAVSGGTVYDALSSYFNPSQTTVSDLNSCVCTSSTDKFYWVYADSLCSNIPVSTGDDFWVKITGKEGNSVIQTAYTLDNNNRSSTGDIYTRFAYSTDGTTWNWSTWTQIVTEKFLSDALANYAQKASFVLNGSVLTITM